jgi:hypothetical protein
MPNFTESSEATRAWPHIGFSCAICNEFADVLRNSWPTSLRLPFPKQLETLAMPAYQSLWLEDDRGLFPIAEARPEDETDTGRSRSIVSVGPVSPYRRPVARTSALRAVRERDRRPKKRSPSATRSVIKLSRESSERLALGKNREMGCQDGLRSVRLRRQWNAVSAEVPQDFGPLARISLCGRVFYADCLCEPLKP